MPSDLNPLGDTLSGCLGGSKPSKSWDQMSGPEQTWVVFATVVYHAIILFCIVSLFRGCWISFDAPQQQCNHECHHQESKKSECHQHEAEKRNQ